MQIFKRKKNESVSKEFLSIEEADQIIKDFAYQSKEMAKRVRTLRRAFMLEDHIPKSYFNEVRDKYPKEGIPYFVCKILALSECIDESLHHRDY
tara:strand:+ start:301 stop:582 length:282 start_codon:yes stop_codon:yes gene_type:complete